MEALKYPRTYHLPWSPGRTSDDKVMSDFSGFEGEEILVTEKMDGENTSISAEHGVYARSTESITHPTRDWVRTLGARIQHELPAGWRICGENLYARHSIPYEDLPSYFLAFGLWDGVTCLSWEDTVAFLEILSIPTVPVLYRGPFSEGVLRGLSESLDLTKQEGFVVRVTREFSMEEFSRVVAKYVRPGHVAEGSSHWLYGRGDFEINGLSR